MTISFVEIEIKIRPVDRRNAPIKDCEAEHTMTATPTEVMNWLRGNKMPSGFQEQVLRTIDRAEATPDPYV